MNPGPSVMFIKSTELVVAMNPIYLEEIRSDLAKMGLGPELLAV